ncbi:MAG: HDOD domain-containing protein [Desulfatitalea sp.]|nr:HDOD domain-containing protein [Desulfatitalea sp.]NNK00631.1 HDOD domain-containing protein [Desulfatitalea sp.]
MPTDRAIRITAAIDAIPSLPAIVARVLEVTDNPESTADELLEVLVADPAYTAKILKLANSAFYSRVREIATVKQAVVVLGYEEIRNMVVATAVFNNFQKIKKVPGFDAMGFWRHAFLTGLAARMLAVSLKKNTGQLFVAGLIHDIGKLVILMALPDEYAKILKMTGNRGLENLDAETHLLGVTHAETGMRLFSRWMYPDLLLRTTGSHHQPHLASQNRAAILVVHLADYLAHIAVETRGGGDIVFPEGCFAQETVSAARTFGIPWNGEAIKILADQLNILMDDQAGVLAMFLS